jgi:hypothetical protein
MKRVLLLLVILAMGGCQSQNPYAAFGPQRVPAPTTSEALPYYPPTAATNAAERGSATTAAPSPRMSVSAEGGASTAPRGTFAADPADREPIRVVENPAAARTASAAARTAPPAVNKSVPSAQPAGGANKSPPAAAPSGAPQSGHSPSGRAPAFNRTRGFTAAQPAKSGDTGENRNDPAVAPAGYQQPAATFVEAPTATGAWRAR